MRSARDSSSRLGEDSLRVAGTSMNFGHYSFAARNWWLVAWAHARQQPTLALHGLQRSGTNYLLQRLMQAGVPVENAIVLRRNMPRHKHFRWQDDKATIPRMLRPQYGNELRVESLDQLHAAAGYGRSCRHIVIRKDELSWLKSILNWGLRCHWYADRDDALARGLELLRDYRAYYGFWDRVGRGHSARVVFVDYDAVHTLTGNLQTALAAIGIITRDTPRARDSVGQVPMSPPGRAELISDQDIRRMVGTPAGG